MLNSATLPLGWNILDTNRTTGGLFGYSSLNCMVNLNVPSSNGVSLGLQWSVCVCVYTQYQQVHTLVRGIWKVDITWTHNTMQNTYTYYASQLCYQTWSRLWVLGQAYPNITAFHNIMLLSVGAPLTPAGGSSWSLCVCEWVSECVRVCVCVSETVCSVYTRYVY